MQAQCEHIQTQAERERKSCNLHERANKTENHNTPLQQVKGFSLSVVCISPSTSFIVRKAYNNVLSMHDDDDYVAYIECAKTQFFRIVHTHLSFFHFVRGYLLEYRKAKIMMAMRMMMMRNGDKKCANASFTHG